MTYFTPRQLVALTTFSDLVAEAMERVKQDAATADLPRTAIGLDEGGCGATAYAEAVGVYLAFAVDRTGADRTIAICAWDSSAPRAIRNYIRPSSDSQWFGITRRGNPNSCDWELQATGNLLSMDSIQLRFKASINS